MKQVSILGATGSIGGSTLKVIRSNPEIFAVHSVVAHKNVDKMFLICQEFTPKYAVMNDEEAADDLRKLVARDGLKTEVLGGEAAIVSLVKEPEIDLVVAAIVGAKGLVSSHAAVLAGKRILLANKESLVVGGTLFMDAVKKHGATLLPIDSEHNALFQCLPKDESGAFHLEGVRQLILTASGGPFRTFSKDDLKKVTLQDALKHPNWDMGPKVTIDSSTLMNKGLEFIEAHFLFNMPADKIEVLVHPESIIHSLVEYQDGSFLAQLGEADMAIPISHALGYPERVLSGAKRLDLTEIATLHFEKPDLVRFPALRLAKEALSAGATHLVALNGANEVIVNAFLNEMIAYHQIPEFLETLLESVDSTALGSVDDLLAYDSYIRVKTRELIKESL